MTIITISTRNREWLPYDTRPPDGHSYITRWPDGH